jgi:hypothetical protein
MPFTAYPSTNAGKGGAAASRQHATTIHDEAEDIELIQPFTENMKIV